MKWYILLWMWWFSPHPERSPAAGWRGSAASQSPSGSGLSCLGCWSGKAKNICLYSGFRIFPTPKKLWQCGRALFPVLFYYMFLQKHPNFVLKAHSVLHSLYMLGAIVLTDLTLCPMPMISFPSFFILLTNSMGSMPLSNALLNCFAAASRAPPKRSPWEVTTRKIRCS